MKFKLFLVALFCAISFVSFGQVTSDFFGHIHFAQAPKNPYARTVVLQTDSVYTGARPYATTAIGYTANGGTTILVFAGVEYAHVTHNTVTNTDYTNWGIAAAIGTGASNGSVSLANATTVGVFGQFFNGLLNVGVGYNFFNKIALPLVGPGVAFH